MLAPRRSKKQRLKRQLTTATPKLQTRSRIRVYRKPFHQTIRPMMMLLHFSTIPPAFPTSAYQMNQPQSSHVSTITHLKTLECFSRLRQSIASTDGLFSIENATIVEIARTSSLANGEGADELLPKLAEKRWAVYITFHSPRLRPTWRPNPDINLPTTRHHDHMTYSFSSRQLLHREKELLRIRPCCKKFQYT